jgi:hypothetical protein
MGDVMLYGVLRMPFDMAMSSYLSQRQFYDRVQEAARRLESAEARLVEIDSATPPSHSAAPVKDHVVREVVNRLRDTALEFHAHGSLRERFARELEPLLVASRPAEVVDERQWVVAGGRRAGRTFLAALARDAERYRWMRNAQWFKAGIAKTELNASSFHYSGDLLDQLVDAGRAAGVRGEGAGK